MKNNEFVLSENLVVSSRGKVLNKNYRAVLIRKPSDKYSPNGNGDVIAIEQPFDDRWGPTGGVWYAETLLVDPDDRISIDAGQHWQVESGLLEALKRYKASKLIDQARKGYCYDDVFIDDDATVEEVDGGAWVQARIWVDVLPEDVLSIREDLNLIEEVKS